MDVRVQPPGRQSSRGQAMSRFVGHCHGCRREDREVETRYDRGALTLCDDCVDRGPIIRNRLTAPLARAPAPARPQQTDVSSSRSCSVDAPVPVPVPVPYLLPQEGERADVEVLLDRHETWGDSVEMPPMQELPRWATPAMRLVYGDLALCVALHVAAGDDGSVIYAVDWGGGRLGIGGGTGSTALKRFGAGPPLLLLKKPPPWPPEPRWP